jgi:hypothetical protein
MIKQHQLLGRVIQMYESTSQPQYLPDLAEQLGKQYKFVIIPENKDLLPSDPPKGAEFKHGKMVAADGREIVINTLTVFNDGVVIDTISTDDSEIFLADLIRWADSRKFGIRLTGIRYYLSHIEVELPRLSVLLSQLGALGIDVTRTLRSYGIPIPDYTLSNLGLSFDPLGYVGIQPSAFQLDRRAGKPFSENLWFSQAPLKTKDHITMLDNLSEMTAG